MEVSGERPVEKLTIGQLDTVNSEELKERLEARGLRLVARGENWKKWK